jgi:hypothetical protein
MPSKNTTRKPSHLQPVPDKPIELARSAADWRKLDAKIENAVGLICQHFDAETTQALLFVVDLLTNGDYDRQDRELATYQVQRAAFRYTPEFEAAQNSYLDRLNLARRRTA